MKITTLVLDFDGTCTDIPSMDDAYMEACRAFLVDAKKWTTHAKWAAALDAVRKASPEAGWVMDGGPPSAPAAADPYILGGEAAAYIARAKGMPSLPQDLNPYGAAYQTPGTKPAFRAELPRLLREVAALDIAIHFVSNTRTDKLTERITKDLDIPEALRASILKSLQGGAEKYRVNEPKTAAPELRRIFEGLPETIPSSLGRPIYLRRGSYLDALSKVWGDDASKAAETIVCGDIWELDHTLPVALGCQTHLIERAAPYKTYDYERELAKEAKATVSPDLNALLDRIKASA